MIVRLTVFGAASKKIIKDIKLDTTDVPNESLLIFLSSFNVNLASSCYGNGICRKCVVNDGILSCRVLISELAHQGNEILINVSYL